MYGYIKAALSPCFTYSGKLTSLGTSWAAFKCLLRKMCMDESCNKVAWCGMCTALAGEVLPGLIMSAACEMDTKRAEGIADLILQGMHSGNFYLYQSQDALVCLCQNECN